MTDFPTREQAQGLLILRGITVDGNSDARAIIEAYIDGRLVPPIKKCEHGWTDGHYTGEYIDYSHGDQRRYSIWCEGGTLSTATRGGNDV